MGGNKRPDPKCQHRLYLTSSVSTTHLPLSTLSQLLVRVRQESDRSNKDVTMLCTTPSTMLSKLVGMNCEGDSLHAA
jgi:hypothetical protein